MGAEQSGYLVKGPKTIPMRRIAMAVRACTRLRKELIADADSPGNSGSRSDAAFARTGEYFDPADIPEHPESAIQAFVEWWHDIEGRDTCTRQDPDDPRQVLVYAGGMSSGDEPDGDGYQKLKQALAWGYAEALGIR